MILHVLIAMVTGWLQRHQQQVITYLIEENRILKAQLGGRRLRLTDTKRRRLAALAHPLGRQRLQALATLVTPDTLLRWYKCLIAQKFDGSKQRAQLGRPRVAEEIEQLVVRMAEENPTWGSRRIQGALANLGHPIDKLTVRNILRRYHMGPAPQRRKAGMSWSQFLTMHWEVLAATDFFTVEVATWHGLVTYYVLVVSATAWKCSKTGKMKMVRFSGIKFAAGLAYETHNPLPSHEIRRKRIRRQIFSTDAKKKTVHFQTAGIDTVSGHR